MSSDLLWDIVAHIDHFTHAHRFVDPAESHDTLLASVKAAADDSFELLRGLVPVQLRKAELQRRDCIAKFVHLVFKVGHGFAPVLAKRGLRLRGHSSNCVGSMAVSPRGYSRIIPKVRPNPHKEQPLHVARLNFVGPNHDVK
jgi:hypothetical protein